MKRKTQPKNIERKIQLFVAGRKVKTARNKISQRQATREIGEERLFTRGDTTSMTRRIGRFARITVTWTATHSTIDPVVYTERVGANDAKHIIRKNMII